MDLSTPLVECLLMKQITSLTVPEVSQNEQVILNAKIKMNRDLVKFVSMKHKQSNRSNINI